MADTSYVLQAAFTGGEISPSMIARSDVSKVGMSAMTMRNRLVLPHGPTECRPGFEMIYPCGDSTHDVVVRPFVFGTEQEYILEFGEYYLRFFKDGGVIVKTTADTSAWVTGTAYVVNNYVKVSTTIYRCISSHTSGATTEPGTGASWETKWVADDVYQITTPYTHDEIYDINLTQSADTVYLLHPVIQQQVLTRTDHNAWTITPYTSTDGPFMPANKEATTLAVSATTGTGKTMTASVATFEADHVGSLWKISHTVVGQRIQGSFTSATSSSAIRGYGTWKVITHGTWTAKVDLERSTDGSTWKIYRSYSSVADNNVIDSEGSDGLYSYRLTCWSYTSGTCSYDITMEPHDWDGVVKATAYTDTTHMTVDVLAELNATTATADWCEGAWSNVRGFPTCSTFFQNRLLQASTFTQPNLIWGSVSDDYTSFRQSTPTVDDDAVILPLVTRQMNAVRSMVSLAEVLAFTASSEWRIDASSGGVLSPTSALAKVQGYRGASTVDPVMVSNRVLFVQTQGSVLRDLGYKFDEDVYTGSDLTILASHLFRGHTIIDMCYQREPQSIVWCVREDGVLLGLTYLKEQEVWAWHRHDTQGYFESVACITGTTRNELWAVVSRTVGGETKRFVERLSESIPTTDVEDQTHLDCFATYSGAPTTTITGLGYLEGKTVNALADGSVVLNKVVTGGSITLPVAASLVHVGLGYTADLELPDVELQLPDGTIQGRLKKISNVILRLQDARGGTIGTSFTGTMDAIPYDNPTVYGQAIPLFTGEKNVTVPGDFDTRGRICIRQTDPLPMTVLAVIREVTFGG